MVYSNIQNKVDKNSSATLSTIELVANIPYIDFHFNSSSSDYTSRLAATANGVLQIYGGLYVNTYVDTPVLYINGTNISNIFANYNSTGGLRIRHIWSGGYFNNGVATVPADDTTRSFVGTSVTTIAQFTMQADNKYIIQSSFNAVDKTILLKAYPSTLTGEYETHIILFGL